jgi:hypothetical protein
VRKGLKGRVAVASNKKNMHCMFFLFDVTEPPQSPVGVAGCARIIRPKSEKMLDTGLKIGYI